MSTDNDRDQAASKEAGTTKGAVEQGGGSHSPQKSAPKVADKPIKDRAARFLNDPEFRHACEVLGLDDERDGLDTSSINDAYSVIDKKVRAQAVSLGAEESGPQNNGYYTQEMAKYNKAKEYLDQCAAEYASQKSQVDKNRGVKGSEERASRASNNDKMAKKQLAREKAAFEAKYPDYGIPPVGGNVVIFFLISMLHKKPFGIARIPHLKPINKNDPDQSSDINMTHDNRAAFNELLEEYGKDGRVQVERFTDSEGNQRLGVGSFKDDQAKQAFINDLKERGIIDHEELINELDKRGDKALVEEQRQQMERGVSDVEETSEARIVARPMPNPGN